LCPPADYRVGRGAAAARYLKIQRPGGVSECGSSPARGVAEDADGDDARRFVDRVGEV